MAIRERLGEIEEAIVSGGSGTRSEMVHENAARRFFQVCLLARQPGDPPVTIATAFPGMTDSDDELIGILHRTLHEITTATPVTSGDLGRALPMIADAAMQVSGVDRVSIWLTSDETRGEDDILECIALVDSAGEVTEADMPLLNAPSYMKLLSTERVIESASVKDDPRFAEFLDVYFTPFRITSTLDAPIHSGGRVTGVICIERTDSGPRPWTLQDQVLAASFAEIISFTKESAKNVEVVRALSRLETEKALILDGVQDVVVHLSSDLKVLWSNNAAARALGLDVLEKGADWAGIWAGADLPPDVVNLITALPEKDMGGTEMPYPDGRYRYTSISSLSTGTGESPGYVLFAHDTTDRRYSTQLYEATRRIISSGLTVMETDDLYREIHGIISEIIEADNFYIALYDSDRDILSFPYYIDRYTSPPEPRKPGRGFTEMVLRGGKPLFLTESDIARFISDGQTELIGVLSHWWVGVPLTVDDRVVGVMTVQSYSGGAIDQRMKDALLTLSGAAALVIEKRRSEDALKVSEARYRALAEHAKDGIVLISNNKVTYANDSLMSMLGLSFDEVKGRQFVEFVTDAEKEIIATRHEARMKGLPVPAFYETVLRKKDDTQVPVEMNVSTIAEPHATGVLAIIRDVSDRRKIEDEQRLLERQIQHSQKLESLGILAGGIAHDFNNLLMGILGNAGLALMELPPESPVRRTIERLETAALRAAELTNQLLAYSGRGKFVVEPVSMNVLIEEMVNLLQAAVPKNTVLRLDLARELPLIEGDATQLRQIVMNLIMNASEAIGDKSGVITVATGVTYVDKAYLSGTYIDEDLPEAVYTFVEVSDTGCGMDEKTRARIFDPFFTTKFTGRGLGLAAVLGIVRGHHGTLKVYSEPGRGSSFKILMPSLGERIADQAGTQVGDGFEGRGATILVVDDEESVRTIAKLALERCGFRVLTAADGREAVEQFRDEEREVDLVLLDMTMPHMNGEEAFREMRRICPDVKVILSSGYNEMDAAGRFSGKGLAGFIQKPYRPVDLIARVRSVLFPDDRAPGQTR